jgi:hypothetical protein
VAKFAERMPDAQGQVAASDQPPEQQPAYLADGKVWGVMTQELLTDFGDLVVPEQVNTHRRAEARGSPAASLGAICETRHKLARTCPGHRGQARTQERTSRCRSRKVTYLLLACMARIVACQRYQRTVWKRVWLRGAATGGPLAIAGASSLREDPDGPLAGGVAGTYRWTCGRYGRRQSRRLCPQDEAPRRKPDPWRTSPKTWESRAFADEAHLSASQTIIQDVIGLKM